MGYSKETRKKAVQLRKRGCSLRELSDQLAGAQTRKRHTKELEESYLKQAKEEIRLNPNYNKIICAMIYWCEGAKSAKGVAFTNLDPKLVRIFLKLLRESFELDESKFHPCIHLHSYHLPEKQLDFWSKVTDINKQQFIKPYLKANSGKRIHENYQGCISVVYHSSDLARRLMAIAKAFID